jgi:hypothetical protein
MQGFDGFNEYLVKINRRLVEVENSLNAADFYQDTKYFKQISIT